MATAPVKPTGPPPGASDDLDQTTALLGEAAHVMGRLRDARLQVKLAEEEEAKALAAWAETTAKLAAAGITWTGLPPAADPKVG